MKSRDLFEILVRENAGMVRGYLLTCVRDPGTVEDLVQESFLVAWRTLDRYDTKRPFGPWIRGIATHLMLNHRRRAARSPLSFHESEALTHLDGAFEQLRSLPGDTFDEKLDALRACYGCLSDSQRAALDLHYEHGLGCKDIGSKLGLSFEAVKKHLQRGRAALLACIRTKIPSVELDESTAAESLA